MKTSDNNHVNPHTFITPNTFGFEGISDIVKIILAVILPPLGSF